MTAEEAEAINRAEFEADCRAARQRAADLVRQYRKKPRATGWVEPRQVTPKAKPIKYAKQYTHEGRSMTLRQWSEATGIAVSALHYRLQAGMPFSVAISRLKFKRRVPWQQQVEGVVENFPETPRDRRGSAAQELA